jgi:hypothetical protein
MLLLVVMYISSSVLLVLIYVIVFICGCWPPEIVDGLYGWHWHYLTGGISLYFLQNSSQSSRELLIVVSPGLRVTTHH